MDVLRRAEISDCNFKELEVGDWAIFLPLPGEFKSSIEAGNRSFVKITGKKSIFYYSRTDVPLFSLFAFYGNQGIPCCGWELGRVEGLSDLPSKAELQMLAMLRPDIPARSFRDLNRSLIIPRILSKIRKLMERLCKSTNK